MTTRRYAIFLSALSIGVLLLFECVPPWQESIFIHGTFWFMLCLVLIWLRTFTTYTIRWDSVSNHIRTHRLALFFLCVGAIILSISVPFELRVLADESNLLSTSRSLLDHKEFQNSISGKFYYDNYHTTHTALPIRPPFFSFLLSLVHSILGYAPENAGWLNLGCWMGLIYVLYLNLYKNIPSHVAMCIIPLMLSIPILSLCTRSGGFDLLSVFLLSLIFHTLRQIDEEPRDHRFWMLWSYLLLFIHTRYENIILLAFILPYLSYKHQIHRHKYIELWTSTGVLFLLPKWFQMRFASGQYENEDQALLSLFHLKTHISSFLSSLTDTSFVIPYNNTLNLLGIIGCGWLIWNLYQKIHTSRVLLEIGAVGLFSCIFFAHFLGDPQNQTSLRFFLMLNITLALLALYTLNRLRIGPANTMIFSVAMVCIYHPIAVRNEYMNALVYPREARVVYEHLQPFRSSNTLLLIDMPGAFVIQDIGALSIEYANLHVKELHNEFQQHLYEHIFVVQRVIHKTQKPVDYDILDEQYQLLPVLIHQTSDEYFLRISEVLNIEEKQDSTP